MVGSLFLLLVLILLSLAFWIRIQIPLTPTFAKQSCGCSSLCPNCWWYSGNFDGSLAHCHARGRRSLWRDERFWWFWWRQGRFEEPPQINKMVYSMDWLRLAECPRRQQVLMQCHNERRNEGKLQIPKATWSLVGFNFLTFQKWSIVIDSIRQCY